MSITDVQRGDPCKRNRGWTTRNLGCLEKIGGEIVSNSEHILAFAASIATARSITEYGRAVYIEFEIKPNPRRNEAAGASVSGERVMPLLTSPAMPGNHESMCAKCGNEWEESES